MKSAFDTKENCERSDRLKRTRMIKVKVPGRDMARSMPKNIQATGS